ncbi:MAG: hypothetical protein JXL97_02000 [Bacteroidales bacterium]|nr:hypothetical protein [Bacteroidales bacterium]
MKATTIGFLFVLFFLASASLLNAQCEYNLSTKDLKGNVKYYHEESFVTVKKDGKWQKGSRRNIWQKDQNIWFDEDGHYTKLQTINSDGTIFEEQVFKYDENNKLTEIERTYNGESGGKIIFTYDCFNNLIEKISYDEDNEIEEKTEYKYNNKNLKTSEITHEEDEIFVKNKYNYNENNLMFEWEKEYPQENERSTLYFEYNEKNVLIKTTKHDFKGGIIEETQYIYNQNGQISEEIKYGNNNIIDYKNIFKYDENDNLIEKIIERNVFNTITYKYDLDEQGNIIKGLEYKGEDLIYIFEYQIEYYE